MKKFIQISLLFQCYCISIIGSEFIKTTPAAVRYYSTQEARTEQKVESNASRDSSIQDFYLDSEYQSNLNGVLFLEKAESNNVDNSQPIVQVTSKDSLISLQEEPIIIDDNQDMIQLDLCDNNSQNLQVKREDESLTDKELKQKGYMEPLELQTSFWEISSVPQSPWRMNESNSSYGQSVLFRNEEINRLKILEEEALLMYSQFISPGFDKADYIKTRVEKSMDASLDLSMFSSKDQSRHDLESPNHSCCSEVLEIFDLTTE